MCEWFLMLMLCGQPQPDLNYQQETIMATKPPMKRPITPPPGKRPHNGGPPGRSGNAGSKRK